MTPPYGLEMLVNHKKLPEHLAEYIYKFVGGRGDGVLRSMYINAEVTGKDPAILSKRRIAKTLGNKQFTVHNTSLTCGVDYNPQPYSLYDVMVAVMTKNIGGPQKMMQMLNRVRSMRNNVPREVHMAIKTVGSTTRDSTLLHRFRQEYEDDKGIISRLTTQFFKKKGLNFFEHMEELYCRYRTKAAVYQRYTIESMKWWLRHEGYEIIEVMDPDVKPWFLKPILVKKTRYCEIGEISMGTFEFYKKTSKKDKMQLLEMNKFLFDDNLKFLSEDQRAEIWDEWYHDHQSVYRHMVMLKQRSAIAVIKHEYIDKPTMGLKKKGFSIALVNAMCQTAFKCLVAEREHVTQGEIEAAHRYIKKNEGKFRKMLGMKDREQKDFTAAVFKFILKEFFDIKIKHTKCPVVWNSSKEEFHGFFKTIADNWQSTKVTRAAYLKKYKEEQGKLYFVERRHIPKRFWEVTGLEYPCWKTDQSSEPTETELVNTITRYCK